MRHILMVSFLLLILNLAGCTSVFMLEDVKKGEGQHVIYDMPPMTMAVIAQKAFVALGLVVKRVNYKTERIEVLGYQPEDFAEQGSIYGLYIYKLGDNDSEIYVVRKNRYPTEAFARDARQDLFQKLDELVLAHRGES